VADRITVLRSGRVVASYSQPDFPSNSELAVSMLGTSIAEATEPVPAGPEVVLEVSNLSVAVDRGSRSLRSVSFSVTRGEILGIAGVDGNGQLELMEAIAGLAPVTSGEVLFLGTDVTRAPYARRLNAGIVFVSSDRRHGVVPTLTIGQHFEYALGRTIASRMPRLLQQYGISPARVSYRADRLSGGNQQKMVLARAWERDPRLLLVAYPTQGLDVGAAANVREMLLERSRAGGAIVVASGDLDELLVMCHRVLVMSHGRVVGIQARREFDRRLLAEWLTHSVAG
jgi:simple sugar transport system ATP-binding protein